MLLCSLALAGRRATTSHHLVTVAVVALHCRGTFVFLIGFSAAGGALWASAAFALSFALYCGIVVPLEERMLDHAFPVEYEQYKKNTPRFAWALVLLVLLQCALVVCQQVGRVLCIDPCTSAGMPLM